MPAKAAPSGRLSVWTMAVNQADFCFQDARDGSKSSERRVSNKAAPRGRHAAWTTAVKRPNSAPSMPGLERWTSLAREVRPPRLHTKGPSFGVDDGRRKEGHTLLGARHSSGMENFRNKSCAHEGCITRPSFGVNDGHKKAELCSHATAVTVNVRRSNNRCLH